MAKITEPLIPANQTPQAEADEPPPDFDPETMRGLLLHLFLLPPHNHIFHFVLHHQGRSTTFATATLTPAAAHNPRRILRRQRRIPATLILSDSLVIAESELPPISSSSSLLPVGVNYGQLGNNLPSPSESVKLIQTLKAKRVKIYDANPKILKALQNTDLQVSIMVPNELINNNSSNQTLADQWVHANVVPFYPHTLIRYLLVGNEILSALDKSIWFNLVPAMRKIKHALKTHGITKVKVGTPSAMDVLESSFPLSNIDLGYTLLESTSSFSPLKIASFILSSTIKAARD